MKRFLGLRAADLRIKIYYKLILDLNISLKTLDEAPDILAPLDEVWSHFFRAFNLTYDSFVKNPAAKTIILDTLTHKKQWKYEYKNGVLANVEGIKVLDVPHSTVKLLQNGIPLTLENRLTLQPGPETTDLTGNKDVDTLILTRLDDQSLFNACETNNTFRKLCHDDKFWSNRFDMKFGVAKRKYKSPAQTWKDFYTAIVKNLALSKFESKWKFFKNLLRYHVDEPPSKARFHNKRIVENENHWLWFMPLGKTVNLLVPITDGGDEHILNLESERDYTPIDVLQAIYDYYSVPLSEEEIENANENVDGFEEFVEHFDEPQPITRATLLTGHVGFVKFKDVENAPELPDGGKGYHLLDLVGG
jgi:hypothetical protein